MVRVLTYERPSYPQGIHTISTNASLTENPVHSMIEIHPKFPFESNRFCTSFVTYILFLSPNKVNVQNTQKPQHLVLSFLCNSICSQT